MMDEWSKQRVHIPSTGALPAHATPVTIACSLESSFKYLCFDPCFSCIFHLVLEIQGVNSAKYPVK